MTIVLVTGGTGVLGQELVPRLSRAGYRVRIMSRRSLNVNEGAEAEWAHADLATGGGLAEAVPGAEAVIHAASSPFRRTRAIDVDGTARLLERARAAGLAHFIYISIVGIDRIPLSYYRHKLAAEWLVEQANVPWSILRATQFHTLIDRQLRPLLWTPITFLPTDFRFQSIDPGEVADRLLEIVAAGPSGHLPDLGGPEVLSLGDMARTWMRARGVRRPLIRLPLPGQAAHGFRQGYNTCPENRQGKLTWAEWVRRK